jgi:hypothetical protein
MRSSAAPITARGGQHTPTTANARRFAERGSGRGRMATRLTSWPPAARARSLARRSIACASAAAGSTSSSSVGSAVTALTTRRPHDARMRSARRRPETHMESAVVAALKKGLSGRRVRSATFCSGSPGRLTACACHTSRAGREPDDLDIDSPQVPISSCRSSGGSTSMLSFVPVRIDEPDRHGRSGSITGWPSVSLRSTSSVRSPARWSPSHSSGSSRGRPTRGPSARTADRWLSAPAANAPQRRDLVAAQVITDSSS